MVQRQGHELIYISLVCLKILFSVTVLPKISTKTLLVILQVWPTDHRGDITRKDEGLRTRNSL